MGYSNTPSRVRLTQTKDFSRVWRADQSTPQKGPVLFQEYPIQIW